MSICVHLGLGMIRLSNMNHFCFPQTPCDTLEVMAHLNAVLFLICSWASKDDVWNNLLKKDEAYVHDTRVMDRHPNLQPKMRAILLDWLMEVRIQAYKKVTSVRGGSGCSKPVH